MIVHAQRRTNRELASDALQNAISHFQKAQHYAMAGKWAKMDGEMTSAIHFEQKARELAADARIAPEFSS